MRWFSALVVAASLMQPAMADEAEGVTFNGGVGFTRLEGSNRLDEDAHWLVGLGYRFDNPFALEVNYLEFDADHLDTGASFDNEILQVMGLYHLKSDSRFRPFLSFGGGKAEIANNNDNFVSGGVGFKYDLTDYLAWRTDFQAYVFGRNETDFGFTTGLHFALGGKKSSSMPMKKMSEPARSEKPAPHPVIDAPTDTDGDGVFDSEDQCPETPVGAKVDRMGCPLDGDRDGVPDYRDSCLATPPPGIVDSQGCYKALEEIVRITLDVEFDFDSAKARPEHRGEVKKVADFMGQYPQTRVTLEGHTDSDGSEVYNQNLSQRRAATIGKMLIEDFGVSGSRVSTVGYGESRPVASNATPEGRQENRRVVAEIEAVMKVMP